MCNQFRHRAMENRVGEIPSRCGFRHRAMKNWVGEIPSHCGFLHRAMKNQVEKIPSHCGFRHRAMENCCFLQAGYFSSTGCVVGYCVGVICFTASELGSLNLQGIWWMYYYSSLVTASELGVYIIGAARWMYYFSSLATISEWGVSIIGATGWMYCCSWFCNCLRVGSFHHRGDFSCLRVGKIPSTRRDKICITINGCMVRKDVQYNILFNNVVHKIEIWRRYVLCVQD